MNVLGKATASTSNKTLQKSSWLQSPPILQPEAVNAGGPLYCKSAFCSVAVWIQLTALASFPKEYCEEYSPESHWNEGEICPHHLHWSLVKGHPWNWPMLFESHTQVWTQTAKNPDIPYLPEESVTLSLIHLSITFPKLLKGGNVRDMVIVVHLVRC